MRKRLKEIQRLQQRVAEQRNWIAEHGRTLQGYIDRYNTPESIAQHGEEYAVNIYYADTDELLKLEAELRLLELQEAESVRPGFTWVKGYTKPDGTTVHGHWRTNT
jgi:hypothetical protein